MMNDQFYYRVGDRWFVFNGAADAKEGYGEAPLIEVDPARVPDMLIGEPDDLGVYELDDFMRAELLRFLH